MMRRHALSIAVALCVLAPEERAHAQAVREDLRQEKDQPKVKQKLTKPPKLIKFVEAIYPKEAAVKGIAGKVELLITIKSDGAVGPITVVKSPDPILTKAATDAIKQFKFSPAEVNGKPATIQVQYAYNFAIQDKFKPRTPDWMFERKKRSGADDVVVGRVREQSTRLPIPGASVAAAKYGIEVKADGRGRFGIKDLPPGKVKIKAISLEHKAETVEITVREGEQNKVTFYLPRLKDNPYETVVRGKRRQTTVSRVTLRGKQLTSVPGTFGDPIRVIENLPGLARVPYVGGALLVRGAAPGDSGVFLNGLRIPIIYHFLGGPSVLNPQFLDRIDYYPGNADVRYGRLIAGTINVETRSTHTQQLKGAVDINLLNASLFLNVPITDKISVAGAVRRSYIDAILPAVLSAAGQDATTVVPVYYDYQLRVDVKLGKPGNDMFVLVFGSDDQLKLTSDEADSDIAISLSSQISFHRFVWGWRHQITDRLSMRLQPFVGFDLVNFGTQGANVDIKTWLFGVRQDFVYRASKRLRIRFGLDIEARYATFEAEIPVPVDYRNPAAAGQPFQQGGTGGRITLTDETQPVKVGQWLGGVATYLDAIIDVTDRFQIIPGARGGTIMYLDNVRWVVDPRLTMRYTLFPKYKTTLKAAVGHFSNAPQPNQANEEFGNPDLVLEHAIHSSVGVEHNFLSYLKLDVSFYFVHRYDLAIPTSRIRFVDGQPDPLRFVNAGYADSYGMEFLFKHEVTRNFYGWVAYTLSRSTQNRVEGGDRVRFVFDQTHILTVVASWRFAKGWELGARFRLASGRPETPVLGGRFDADGGFYDQIFGPERSVSRPLFHQLDLRLEKTWFFKLWRLAAYLDVQNVYNAKNPEATLYDYRFRQSGPLRGLPLIPSIGIKGSF
ncbi:MAG: TonB family protein [Myxococcales bacterium]|nr:TonB family protein [Myxococcales bacterium]